MTVRDGLQVLLVSPTGRDAELIQNVCREAGLDSEAFLNVTSAVDAFRAGDAGAGDRRSSLRRRLSRRRRRHPRNRACVAWRPTVAGAVTSSISCGAQRRRPHAVLSPAAPTLVAVGTPVARRPPHRSVHAVLPHTAPA